jgi:hypothetical protein
MIHIAPVSSANIQKYVAQMHIYWVRKTFPEYSRNYVRVFRLGMGTVGHGRSSVSHDRSEAFDRPTDLTDRLV